MAAHVRDPSNVISTVAGGNSARAAVLKNSNAIDSLIVAFNVVESDLEQAQIGGDYFEFHDALESTIDEADELLIYDNDLALYRKTSAGDLVINKRLTSSGAITTGDTVILNDDGTVSAVSDATPNVVSEPETFFTSHFNSICYDTTNDVYVIAGKDPSDSDKGKAAVGQLDVTKKIISWGTPVVFNNAATSYVSCCFSAGVVVIVYRDNGASNIGNSVVGTVSGSTISFGGETSFSANTVANISVCYDTTNSKVITCYEDATVANGKAVVGTVGATVVWNTAGATTFKAAVVEYTSAVFIGSGKIALTYGLSGAGGYGSVGTVNGGAVTISFGAEASFEAGVSGYVSAVWDSANSRVVVGYRDESDSSHVKVNVGSVAATITWGTPEDVYTTAASSYVVLGYDAALGKIIILYRDASNYGVLKTGEVTGLTIALSSQFAFISEASAQYAIAYDPDATKSMLAYSLTGSNIGYGVLYTPSGTNLKADNYMGIAQQTVGDSETCSIKTNGQIDSNQTGLTIKTDYYVENDGSLGTDSNQPYAGKAISTTELMVGGFIL